MKQLAFSMKAAGILLSLSSLLLLLGYEVAGGPGQSLSVNEAKQKISKLAGLGELSEKQVRIKSVDDGIGGKDAVVVAQVETAFKMTRVGDQWQVSEVRVGPGQWESVKLVREAVEHEKERRTAEDLRSLKSAADAFRKEMGYQLKARNIAELDDLLSPRFLEKVIRFDAWGRELRLEESAEGLKVFSAGIDGRYGTKDDIWILMPTGIAEASRRRLFESVFIHNVINNCAFVNHGLSLGNQGGQPCASLKSKMPRSCGWRSNRKFSAPTSLVTIIGSTQSCWFARAVRAMTWLSCSATVHGPSRIGLGVSSKPVLPVCKKVIVLAVQRLSAKRLGSKSARICAAPLTIGGTHSISGTGSCSATI